MSIIQLPHPTHTASSPPPTTAFTLKKKTVCRIDDLLWFTISSRLGVHKDQEDSHSLV